METSTTLEVFIKKQFIAKSSNFMLGKKWWMKTNLVRGRGGEGGQVLKIAAKGHYKTMKDEVNLWATP